MLHSIFRNFTNLIDELSLKQVIEIIKSNEYKTSIDALRAANEEVQEELKKKLPAFTPCGTFTNQRHAETLQVYSKIIHLDFDKIEADLLDIAYELAITNQFTKACFVSPSGNGLKVFVEVDTDQENHSKAYQQVQKYFEKELGIQADAKCKDLARLCFFSHDTNAFYNDASTIFKVDTNEQKQSEKPLRIIQNHVEGSLLDEIKGFTEQKEGYYKGNRNNFLHLFASNCNRQGIEQSEALNYALLNFDLGKEEVKTCFQSAYSKTHEFGKFATLQLCNLQNEDFESDTIENNIPNSLKDTPAFSNDIFEQLPQILKDGCSVFEEPRAKDVFLLSAIGVLSGCLPNVTGLYKNEKVFTNLFTMVIAPPASGKGTMKYAKKLAETYHDTVFQDSKQKKAQYEIDIAKYENQLRSGSGILPSKPKPCFLKAILIPANTSNTRLLQLLNYNKGNGIICETETDIMSQANKQEWGGFSPLLRGAFHHESYSMARKAGDEFIEVKEPKISTILTGTPSQLNSLIHSVEDGLFSRFLFYAFQTDLVWQSPAPKGNNQNYDAYFSSLSKQVYDLVKYLESSPTEILFSNEQWAKFDELFKELLTKATYHGENAASIVYRMGLMTFRICMILTALRKFENKGSSNLQTCSDKDFDIATSLIRVLFEHSLLIFNQLPKNSIGQKASKNAFIQNLPNEFIRSQAIAIKDKFQLSERTVDDLLKSEEGKTLKKIGFGKYQKLNL